MRIQYHGTGQSDSLLVLEQAATCAPAARRGIVHTIHMRSRITPAPVYFMSVLQEQLIEDSRRMTVESNDRAIQALDTRTSVNGGIEIRWPITSVSRSLDDQKHKNLMSELSYWVSL